jgi:hypothetical protein
MTLSRMKYAEAFEVLVVGKLKCMNREVSNSRGMVQREVKQPGVRSEN